jgi:transcriptional regulator with XRE-family HTH domain
MAKERVARQLVEAMREQGISKNRMAVLLGTSRTQVDRLLNPKDDITLGSLERAAAVVGQRVVIELVGGTEREVGVRQASEVEVEEEPGWLG